MIKASRWHALDTLLILIKGTICIVAIVALVVFWQSMIFFFLAIFATVFCLDFGIRQRRNYVSSLNSALRIVSQTGVPMGTAAQAFSKSGPLRRQCEDYTKRLASGEDPLDAAVASHLPLEISTAISMQMPGNAIKAPPYRQQNHRDTATRRTQTLSISCQFFYLIFVSLFSVAALAFFSTFILPQLHSIYSEFGRSSLVKVSPLPTGLVIKVLSVLSLILIFLPLLLSYGLGLRFLPKHWIPLLPCQAKPNADALTAIAEGVDAGWPLQKIVLLGQKISRGQQKQSFTKAVESIESGESSTNAIKNAGWISVNEAAWLDGTPPQRMTQLMRTISRQNLQTADANVNWLVALLFPAVVLLIAAIIAPIAYAFFANLYTLILTLS